jgi:hypothetical protein
MTWKKGKSVLTRKRGEREGTGVKTVRETRSPRWMKQR